MKHFYKVEVIDNYDVVLTEYFATKELAKEYTKLMKKKDEFLKFKIKKQKINSDLSKVKTNYRW